MPPTQRRIAASVIQQLSEEPYRFEFFQAVRVLERWFSRTGAHGGALVGGERIRFGSSLLLTFAPSEIEALQLSASDGEALDTPEKLRKAIAEGRVSRAALTPAFFGLLGVSGALPVHYTEQIAEREMYKRDRAARAFLDLFSNRATAFFYSAWKKYRLPVQYETDQREHFLPQLLALAGINGRAMRYRLRAAAGGVFDESIACFAAMARHRPVSALVLQRVLEQYFQVCIRIEQFIGRWYSIPPAQSTSLGKHNAILGVSAFVGERVWQRDMRLRIRVGPLDSRGFGKFLPGGTASMALGELVMLMMGPVYEYEVCLVSQKASVKPIQLGTGKEGTRLGWDTWLQSHPAMVDRDDVVYEIGVTK